MEVLYRYALGSVLNHVLLHQTIIGGRPCCSWRKSTAPDVLVGCTGGGSAWWSGIPFLREKLAGKMNPTIRCLRLAGLTKGEYRYDFGDTAGLTPLMKMHIGASFIPEPSTPVVCVTAVWRHWLHL